MKAWRIALVAFGIVMLGIGALVLLDTQNLPQIVQVGIWLLGATIVHDGIIAPLVFLVGAGMRKAGKRIPIAVLAIVQAGIVFGGVFSLIVVPEIIAKMVRQRSYTVLPFDYGTRLALLWLATAVLTACAVGVYYALTRRQKVRSSATQA